MKDITPLPITAIVVGGSCQCLDRELEMFDHSHYISSESIETAKHFSADITTIMHNYCHRECCVMSDSFAYIINYNRDEIIHCMKSKL